MNEKDKIIDIILYSDVTERTADRIADYLIENGLTFTKISDSEYQNYCAYKIIEPQIKGCLDRERELEKELKKYKRRTAVAERKYNIVFSMINSILGFDESKFDKEITQQAEREIEEKERE